MKTSQVYSVVIKTTTGKGMTGVKLTNYKVDNLFYMLQLQELTTAQSHYNNKQNGRHSHNSS